MAINYKHSAADKV